VLFRMRGSIVGSEVNDTVSSAEDGEVENERAEKEMRTRTSAAVIRSDGFPG
jgi:hypothetical protein